MPLSECVSISGLVVEYIVAIDVTRVRFPAGASFGIMFNEMVPEEVWCPNVYMVWSVFESMAV